jgi:hypothetical protein
MRREYVIWGVVAGAAGATAGMLLWSRHMRSAKRDLFHRRAANRLAALGYVAARPSVENARLLRDFTAWETRPALRRRAAALLRRMETHLG